MPHNGASSSGEGRVLIEIGSRRGGFLAHLAERNPDAECIGIEYRATWAREARESARRRGLDNLRYICADAREVVRHLLMPEEVDEVYVLFPDPWHKKRHLPRRLLQPGFLRDLSRIMKRGAPLYILTDIADYARCIERDLLEVADLEPLPESLWPDESDWGPSRKDRYPRLPEEVVIRVFRRRPVHLAAGS
ncbi:MAG: tRNA (guanosine(46)-N7)-methyltransferase TrmB [Gemmatimonadetes bacterium]|nr:tRNA (guanosine(46)-N7)-methyltransferase TrmB [Gemmatimonadota bacterium]